MFCHNSYGYKIFSNESTYSGMLRDFISRFDASSVSFCLVCLRKLQPTIAMLIDKCEKSTCIKETLCGVSHPRVGRATWRAGQEGNVPRQGCPKDRRNGRDI